jgi:CelD/BcsL family acetyltransferase involved in cellulose biosynthesis
MTRLQRALFVDVIQDVAGLEALAPEWDDLLARSDADTFFLTWEWLSAWWRHLADDRSLFVLTARDSGRLVGLAPFAVRPARIDRVPPAPVLELIGSGTCGSDYLDVIVDRHFEQEVARVFADALDGTGRMLALSRVRQGTALAMVLGAALEGRGWTAHERADEICPFIRLAGLDWNGYLEQLGSRHREAFRRKHRRLCRNFETRFVRVEREEERSAALQQLIALHDARWTDRGQSEAFNTPALRAFHEDVSRAALARGWLRLCTLTLSGRPAAALYGFVYGGAFNFFQSGFDPALAEHSVGLVTMGLAIQSALEEGCHEYDLLHGTEPYKLHWAVEARALARLDVYPPGLVGLLYRGTSEVTRAARRIGRVVRDGATRAREAR